MHAAWEIAGTIVANDQTAVRSAKATTLDLIGRRLDDQLQVEALYGYSLAARAREIVPGLATNER